jgi:tRNA pseudouridine55 synthase
VSRTGADVPAGFLLVDKPGGRTSHDVVARVRNLSGIKKVGHAGTLDPMATGLLVLGIGRATRLLRFVQDLRKEYVGTAQLGVATDSLDADGAILTREPMPVDESAVAVAFQRFVGEISQVPPMVSARKIEGRRLYELAREGKEVEREARPVTIDSIDVIDFGPSDYPLVTFRVVCSKGTYIRTLADDAARALGGRAHLTALRRVRNGTLEVGRAHTIDAISAAAANDSFDSLLLTPAAGLADFDSVVVDVSLASAVSNGVAMPRSVVDVPCDGPFRVLDEQGNLLAVYRASGAKVEAEVVTA